MKNFKILALLICFSTFQVSAQMLVWNVKTLEKAKNSNSPAAKSIVREADKQLSVNILTVMDKPMTPPGGDKHDYMSMGRYWWPDPDKKDGLPYIRKDGVVNSEIDKLDRMPLSKMARSVNTLSIAYYLTGDEKYASKAVENLRIWFVDKKTKMNPNMNFGQTIPGRNEGKGRGEGVLDTYSFVDMLDAVELLKNSKSLKNKDIEELKNWFTSYLEWMLTSAIGQEENDAKNNHGTAFDVQAARYALFVGKNEVARKIVTAFPEKRLFRQIEPDGSQPLELARTTALGYSVFNLTHFIDMTLIAGSMQLNLLELKSEDGRSIQKAIEFLIPYIGKQVTDFPYKQIKEWDSVQLKLCWELYRVDKLLKKPLYEKYYVNQVNAATKGDELLIY